MRILLIENNEDDVRLIRETFSQTAEPVVLERADRLSKGLERLTSGGIDVVLLDLGLPDSRGLDTFAQVHAAAPTVPVVVLTGSYADDQLALQAVRTGAQSFLTKDELNVHSLRRELQFAVERKKSWNEIQRLSQAVEQSPVLTLVTDLQGRIVYVNPKFSEVTGYTSEEILGQNPRILKSGDTSPEHYAQMWRTVLSGREWQGTFRNKRKNGESYWASTIIAPIRDANGVITHLLGIEEDITARLEAERALRESTRELERANQRLLKLSSVKDEFISTVSHELRTPLAITREGVSQVLDGVPGAINGKQQKILMTAQDSIDRLARLINDLLDVSKLEAGKVTLHRQRVDLRELIRQVADAFEPESRQKGLTLQVSVPHEAILGYADPDKILQVLTNLVGNALKFTEQGSVEIALNRQGNELICRVTDTGRGISKEDLPRIFGKFEQFSRIPGGGERGTGLGLAIAKGLVELHHGTMTIVSEVLRGTTLTFTLPLYTPQLALEESFRDLVETATRSEQKYVGLIAIDTERLPVPSGRQTGRVKRSKQAWNRWHKSCATISTGMMSC